MSANTVVCGPVSGYKASAHMHVGGNETVTSYLFRSVYSDHFFGDGNLPSGGCLDIAFNTNSSAQSA